MCPLFEARNLYFSLFLLRKTVSQLSQELVCNSCKHCIIAPWVDRQLPKLITFQRLMHFSLSTVPCFSFFILLAHSKFKGRLSGHKALWFKGQRWLKDNIFCNNHIDLHSKLHQNMLIAQGQKQSHPFMICRSQHPWTSFQYQKLDETATSYMLYNPKANYILFVPICFAQACVCWL